MWFSQSWFNIPKPDIEPQDGVNFGFGGLV
jgi:hypothetical protein